jgi:hypothetical protein
LIQTGNTLRAVGGGGVSRGVGFYGERGVLFCVLLCGVYGGFYDDDPHLWRGAQA